MDTLLVVDIETTGDMPKVHQCYEFAGVPIIKGIIRPDLAFHRYIRYDNYKFQRSCLFKFGERITTRPESVKEVNEFEWGCQFVQYLKDTFNNFVYFHDETVTLAGVNVGGFDFKFMQEMRPSLRNWDLVNYSPCEVKSLYLKSGDRRLPHARECVQRAKDEGANIKFSLNHTALEDALVTAEIYSWRMFKRVVRAYDDVDYLPKFSLNGVK